MHVVYISLFILYINDLPRNTKNTSPSIFADDTKVNGKVDSKDIWQLKFNLEKCRVRHFGSKNHLCNTALSHVTEEKEEKEWLYQKT